MLDSKALSADTWLQRLESSNYTYLLLFALSMGETLILPIPIEAILIPWMLRKPEKRWVIAAVALAGNITAASLGYWLGALAMEQWGDSLIELFGGAQVYDSFATELKENGFMSVLAVGITPTPLQIAMLAAGATGFSFMLFLLAVTVSRSVRYFGLALLVQFAGDAAMKLWQRYSRQLGAVLLVLAGVWVWFTFFR